MFEFAQELLPLTADLLSLPEFREVHSLAEKQLLPAVLRIIPKAQGRALLFVVLHRLLVPLISNAEPNLPRRSPIDNSQRAPPVSSTGSEVLDFILKAPRSEAQLEGCVRAFELAAVHVELFLDADEAPPPTLCEAEGLLLGLCQSSVVRRPPDNAEGAGAKSHSAFGNQDLRWRWLFWGLTCSVQRVRGLSRQLLSRLFQLGPTHSLREARDAQLTALGIQEGNANEDAWQRFLQLLEALDEFGQHLIRQQWVHLEALCLAVAAAEQGRTAKGHSTPTSCSVCPVVLQSLWVEVVFLRALWHHNTVLAHSFCMDFLQMCIAKKSGKEAASNSRIQQVPILLCLSSTFVFKALVPFLASPAFFSRISDCRLAERCTRAFFLRRLDLECRALIPASQICSKPSTDSSVTKANNCPVSHFLRTVGEHCSTYTPLRVMLEVLLSDEGVESVDLPIFTALSRCCEIFGSSDELFASAEGILTQIRNAPYSVRRGLLERLCRILTEFSPPHSLTLPRLGDFLAALPLAVFASECRVSCCASEGDAGVDRRMGWLGRKFRGVGGVLQHLVKKAFPDGEYFRECYYRQVEDFLAFPPVCSSSALKLSTGLSRIAHIVSRSPSHCVFLVRILFGPA